MKWSEEYQGWLNTLKIGDDAAIDLYKRYYGYPCGYTIIKIDDEDGDQWLSEGDRWHKDNGCIVNGGYRGRLQPVTDHIRDVISKLEGEA